jgi:hypothetical protein
MNCITRCMKRTRERFPIWAEGKPSLRFAWTSPASCRAISDRTAPQEGSRTEAARVNCPLPSPSWRTGGTETVEAFRTEEGIALHFLHPAITAAQLSFFIQRVSASFTPSVDPASSLMTSRHSVSDLAKTNHLGDEIVDRREDLNRFPHKLP